MGSFAVTTRGSTGPGNNYTLYYPTQIATDGYQHPSLVWGNGALAAPSNYTTLLTTIASNGFVIIEYDSTPNAQQMTDAIDWLVAQNEAQGSVLYHHLDISEIAAGGHSAGSLAAFDVAADPRLVTTVHLSGGTMSPHTELANLRHAALFVCGDVPTGAGLTTGDVANPNCEYDFENATVPVFYGMQKGASHLSTYDGIGDDTQRTQFARAIIGWLWLEAGGRAAPCHHVRRCLVHALHRPGLDHRAAGALTPSPACAWPATMAALFRANTDVETPPRTLGPLLRSRQWLVRPTNSSGRRPVTP